MTTETQNNDSVATGGGEADHAAAGASVVADPSSVDMAMMDDGPDPYAGDADKRRRHAELTSKSVKELQFLARSRGLNYSQKKRDLVIELVHSEFTPAPTLAMLPSRLVESMGEVVESFEQALLLVDGRTYRRALEVLMEFDGVGKSTAERALEIFEFYGWERPDEQSHDAPPEEPAESKEASESTEGDSRPPSGEVVARFGDLLPGNIFEFEGVKYSKIESFQVMPGKPRNAMRWDDESLCWFRDEAEVNYSETIEPDEVIDPDEVTVAVDPDEVTVTIKLEGKPELVTCATCDAPAVASAGGAAFCQSCYDKRANVAGGEWIEPEDVPRNATDGELVSTEYELGGADTEDPIPVEPVAPPPPTSSTLSRIRNRKPYTVEDIGEPNTPEWYAGRNNGIGASEVPIVLGLSPFKDAAALYHEKVTGEREPDPDYMEPYSMFGRWFEPYVFDTLRRRNRDLRQVPEQYRSRLHGFMTANLDGMDDQRNLPHEIKTEERQSERPKLHHVVQAQAQMLVTGADAVRLIYFTCPMKRTVAWALLNTEWLDSDSFGWFLVEHGTFTHFDVQRDPAFIARMVDRCAEFWDAVESGAGLPDTPPEGTWIATDEALQLALDAYVADRDDKVRHADVVDRLDVEAALCGENPSKIVCGPYTASKVSRTTGTHWRILQA